MTGPLTKKYLDPAQIDEAVAEAADIAKRSGTRIALLGGVAMQLLGSDRLTTDVDFAVDTVPDDLQVTKHLTFGGVQAKLPNGVAADFIARTDDFAGLYEEALDHAVRVDGVDVPVILPEYIAAMKMVAGRAGKDMPDLAFLITSQSIDLDATKAIVRKHLGAYAVKEFNAFVEEAYWQASRQQ